MSSYHTSYPPSSPSLSDPIGASTLPSNDQPGPYLNSQLDIPSPAYTSSARVSKAMKGKRVHACEYPGCDKVNSNEYPHCVCCSSVARRYLPEPSTEDVMNSATNRENNIHAHSKDVKRHSIAQTIGTSTLHDSEDIPNLEKTSFPTNPQ
jgi:hypothetical protein